MGATVKRMMDEVASRMEIDDTNDPRVLEEVGRLLAISHRRLIVIESHPNSGGFWTGKVGTEQEVLDYLTDADMNGLLDYVFCILELKEKSDHETCDWLELDGNEPIGLRKVKIGRSPDGTPPLPGLEKRLAGIEADGYGQHRSVWSLLQAMTDEEIALTFSDTLQEMLQSGRELPKVGVSK